MPEPTASAGEHYSRLISEQLDNERAIKASLEQRGIAVVATAGTLVTLLFALGALVTRSQTFEPPAASVVFLLLALLAFLAASVAAIATNRVRTYEEVKIGALRVLLDENLWAAESSIGERRAAEVRVAILAIARNQNAKKAKSLKWAMRSEVTAVGLVAIAVAAILLAN